jgi:YidC/Oxa1 family membrane protein insertase
MELYKNNKVNPFSSCLPILLQLPILIALYTVFRTGLTSTDIGGQLYSFIHNPGKINPLSLGFIDLAHPNYIIAVLAGVAQFWQSKSMTKKTPPPPALAGAAGKDEDMMSMMNKQMLYMMPVMTTLIGFSLPAGLTLYWFMSTVLMSAQQYLVARKMKSKNSPTPPTSSSVASEVDKKIIEGEIIVK